MNPNIFKFLFQNINAIENTQINETNVSFAYQSDFQNINNNFTPALNFQQNREKFL